MYYLAGLIIPILSFIFQSYPRILNRYFGVDVWTRLIETDLVRKNRHHIPQKKIGDGFIIEGFFDYPPIFPWLLSFINKKILLEIQGFIAPIFDIVQNVLIFLIAYQITSRIDIAILAQLIYASIPLLVLENSYLTPRSLGYLNFTLAFYPLLLFSTAPKPIYLLFGFVFVTLSFFTHRFATQSLLFASVFFSIIDKTPFYIFIFFAGMALAIIISKGYYLTVLKGHLYNIYFWVKNYKYRFAHQIRGLVPEKRRDLVGQVYYLLGTFTPITLIGTNLWLIVPLAITFTHIFNSDLFLHNQPYNELLYIKMSYLTTFFYILSTLVLSIKFLIPIGEGQRYLEMITASTSILTALTISALLNTDYRTITLIIFTFILITNISLTIFLQIKGIIQDKNRSRTKGMEQIFSFINKYKIRPRILCIPHQITTMVLYNTRAKVFVNVATSELMKVSDVYPILKYPIKDIAKKYNLNILVLKKYYASMEELKLPKKDLLLETEDTQIIKID